MKTHEEFSVPLSDRTAEIIAEARSRAREEPTADGFVFFGVAPKKPLSNMALAAPAPNGRGRDRARFRTSFRTWCSDVAHIEFEVAEACLSHRIGSAVSRAYARADMLERGRPVMQAWSRFLSGKTPPRREAVREAADDTTR